MRVIVFLVLVFCAVSYRTVQYEWGTDQPFVFNTGHIMERQAGVPRSIERTIQFKQEFQVAPQIAIVPKLLDWQFELPAGFLAKVTQVTTKFFKVQITAVSPRQFYSFFFNWYAFYDPNIRVYTFETVDLGPLKQGEGDRKINLNVPIDFPEVQTGLIFLTGAKHVHTNPIVEVKIESLAPKVAVIQARTYWIARVEMVHVTLILGTAKSLWSQQGQFYEAPGGNHPFVKRAPGGATVAASLELPKLWQSGTRVPLGGFRGYDNERARNFRLNVDIKLEAKLNLEIQTWWDTFMYGVMWQAGVYAPDTDLKIFDPNCAELFSECDFKGDSITVCDRIPDLPDAGWSKPIKSLTVPTQRRLYLFNKEKYEGKKLFFIQNQKCMEEVQFTFAQLGHNEILTSQ